MRPYCYQCCYHGRARQWLDASTPTDISRARRAAILSRLTQERRLSAERAEALVSAWEAEGDSRGLERMTAAFWEAGTTWIFEQLGEKK